MAHFVKIMMPFYVGLNLIVSFFLFLTLSAAEIDKKICWWQGCGMKFNRKNVQFDEFDIHCMNKYVFIKLGNQFSVSIQNFTFFRFH
jgi:hypothetical protein